MKSPPILTAWMALMLQQLVPPIIDNQLFVSNVISDLVLLIENGSILDLQNLG